MCAKRTLCFISVWIYILQPMLGQYLYTDELNSQTEKIATKILKTEMQHITQNFERTVMVNLQRIVEGKMNEMLEKIKKENMDKQSTGNDISRNLTRLLSDVKNKQVSISEEIRDLRMNQSLRGELDQLKIMMANVMMNITENYNSLRNPCNYTSKTVDQDKTGIDCADILKKFPEMRNKNDVYNITGPKNDRKAVYCDMTTDNGGWMIIQQRINGLTDFYRNWSEYRNGFGDPNEDHWLGLEMMHTLTTKKAYELRVDVQRFNGDRAYAEYSTFAVAGEVSKYKLNVKGYSGTAGDSMTYSSGMKFSTKDQDNDTGSGQCATYWKSAGWFKSCFYTNPNGQYADSEKNGSKYVAWYYWKKKNLSLKSIKMMIRPKN